MDSGLVGPFESLNLGPSWKAPSLKPSSLKEAPRTAVHQPCLRSGSCKAVRLPWEEMLDYRTQCSGVESAPLEHLPSCP